LSLVSSTTVISIVRWNRGCFINVSRFFGSQYSILFFLLWGVPTFLNTNTLTYSGGYGRVWL
jgi:hypothetical protein